MKGLLLTIPAVVLIALCLVRGGAAGAEEQKARPEHARLLAMSGDYEVAMVFRFAPGQEPVRLSGRARIKPVLGRNFTEETLEGALGGKQWTSLSYTGFNPSSGKYEATRLSSTSPATISQVGTWDEKTSTITFVGEYLLAGESWHERDVIRIDPDSIHVDSFLSFGKVPEWKGVELSYKRRAP